MLARANAGLWSKNAQAWFALLNRHTLVKLSTAIRLAKTSVIKLLSGTSTKMNIGRVAAANVKVTFPVTSLTVTIGVPRLLSTPR